jgi:polysaccharide export outer membrane protein
MAHSGKLRTLMLSVLLSACAFGCASTSGPVATKGAAQPQQVAAQYIIGPGDVLKIVVLRNPELNAEVPVRPDGKISTPLVNDVVAVGKTPTQLASEIDKMLSEFVRQPNVSVIVTHATSASSQVKVVGQAVTPRALPYRAGMTVLDLVIEVGGLSQFAAGNRAKIIRSDGTTTHEIRVRLDDLLNKGAISENINLQPGDILFIPETLF